MSALYNEIDKNAAAWLRQLIIAGHIAPGVVDERDIRDLEPDYVATFTQFHAFAGIGVWSHALRRGGWSDDRPVWTGSCPCQPFSAAGKGGGFDDERHLWPAFHHLIAQCRPDVVLGEQVASKDGLGWLDLVHADLEGEGYAVGAVDTCAAGFGAPHIRQRLYWGALADADHAGLEGRLAERQRAGQRTAVSGGVAGGLAAAQGDRHERCGQLDQSTGRDVTAYGGASSLVRLDRSDANPAHPVAAPQPATDGPNRLDDDHGDRSGRAQSCLSIGQQGSDGGQLRPGPTNGFWGTPDWLHCRDGRWRPVEARPQSLVDGSAESLGRVCAETISQVEGEVNEWASRYQMDAGEALLDLRRTLLAQAVRVWATGGPGGLSEAPFLLAFLRQLTEQGWAFAERLSGQGAQAPEIAVRVLPVDDSTSCTPRERGLDGQPSGERANALRILSSVLARHAQAAWDDAHAAHAEIGFPLGRDSRSRVARLRGFGNAIVAPQAQAFVECVLEAVR